MTYKKVKFMSQSSIMMQDGDKNSIAISITNSSLNNIDLAEKFEDVLYLKFDNVETLSSRYLRFNRQQALEVYAFVKKYEGKVDNIYVNCLKGESRSAAIAKFLSDYYNISLEQDTSLHLPFVYKVLTKIFTNMATN